MSNLRNPVKDYLDRSPAATTIVVFAAVIGFLLSLPTSFYSAWTHYQSWSYKPSIATSDGLAPDSTFVISTSYNLGGANTIRGYATLNIAFPYHSLSVRLHNPTDAPVTFYAFRLFVSQSSFDPFDPSVIYSARIADIDLADYAIRLESHEIKDVALIFGFSADAVSRWRKVPWVYYVACLDDRQTPYRTSNHVVGARR